MFTVIKTTLVLSALLAAPTGFLISARAAETPASAKQAQTLTGKVVAVDKTKRMLSLDINGSLFHFGLGAQVKISRNGSVISLENLLPGQTVSVVAVPVRDGNLEIAAISIEAGDVASQPAGKSDGSRSDGSGPPSPFPGNANPANVGGPIRSPSR